MYSQRSIKNRMKTMAPVLVLLTLGVIWVSQASAGCLQFQPPTKSAAAWQTPNEFFSSQKLVKVSDENPTLFAYPAPIVGLWAFKYTSEGNESTLGILDGTKIDGGNTTWFADGNEFTYSGVRDPATGAVCLGVWKQLTERTYVLNHIGLSWDPITHAPAGPAFIKQLVTLSEDGKSYTGTFTINQLAADGKTPALPAPIRGTIIANRVSIDTDTQAP